MKLASNDKAITYAEAVEVLKEYQLDIEDRRERIAKRYERGAGDTELTRFLEITQAEHVKGLEHIKAFVCYLFGEDEGDLADELAKEV